MDQMKKILSFFKRRHEENPSQHFLQNGGALLEKLIAASNGKYNTPIRSFTAEELKRATNDFSDVFHTGRFGKMFKGSCRERQTLVKKFINLSRVPDNATYDALSGVINNIATTAQMSHHRNVLKLLGCCLEFEHPALVYEYAGEEKLLDLLLNSNSNKSLTWGSRLKIAGDIASLVLYLHTAFSTPIIYRILNPGSIIVDKCGVAKLFDFSYSISLPPGELQMQDDVIGVTGYIDYEYYVSGIVSQATDVYSFGVLLLVLLTGQGPIRRDHQGDQIHVVHYIRDCISRNESNHIVDPKISKRDEIVMQEHQLRAYLDLALKCTQENSKDRPNMIDIAKDLLEIKSSFQDLGIIA